MTLNAWVLLGIYAQNASAQAEKRKREEEEEKEKEEVRVWWHESRNAALAELKDAL